MNNDQNNWIFSFHNDKNISFATASILTGFYQFNSELPQDKEEYKRKVMAIKAVHNLSTKQAKEAIETAKQYINNNNIGKIQ